MSTRAATIIKEQMEYMGPQKLSDVEGTRQKIVSIILGLRDAGEIIIP